MTDENIKKVSPTQRPYYDLEAARIQAKHELDNVLQRAEAYCKSELPKDEQVDVILDRIQEKIMRDAIMAELLAVCPECGEPLVWRANWHYPMYECPKCLATWEKTEQGMKRFFFG